MGPKGLILLICGTQVIDKLASIGIMGDKLRALEHPLYITVIWYKTVAYMTIYFKIGGERHRLEKFTVFGVFPEKF